MNYNSETQAYGSVQAMNDNRNGTGGDISRRRLLRTAGAAAGAAALGLTVTAAPAAAEACPRPAAYWAEAAWPETEALEGSTSVAGEQRSDAAWKLRLSMPPEDAGQAMARQLLTTRLNFQHRWKDDPGCVDAPLSDYDGRTLRGVKAEARAWLEASNWPASQSSWVVDGVDGRPLYEVLARFNHAEFTELDCTCTERSVAHRYDREGFSPEDETRRGDGPDGHRLAREDSPF